MESAACSPGLRHNSSMNKDESDPISPLGHAVISSMDEYLRRCVIPIAIADQGSAGVQGAASLFRLGDKRYLIGAAQRGCFPKRAYPLPRCSTRASVEGRATLDS